MHSLEKAAKSEVTDLMRSLCDSSSSKQSVTFVAVAQFLTIGLCRKHSVVLVDGRNAD